MKCFTLFILLFLASCGAQSPRTGKTLGAKDAINNDSSTPTETVLTEQISWYTDDATPLKQTIRLNANSSKVLFLQGSLVQDYLSHQGAELKSYCFSFAFSGNTLRVRGIPQKISSNNQTLRRFRLDMGASLENTQFCKNPGNATTSLAGLVFKLSDICPTCNLVLSTQNITWGVSNGSRQNETLDANLLQLSLLSFEVDPLSQSNNPNPSCSDSLCQAQGFDCCLSGQSCAHHGTVRPNISTHPDYNEAYKLVIDQKQTNLLSLYPHIFFVCPQGDVIGGQKPVPPTTPEDAAAQRLITLGAYCKDSQDSTCSAAAITNLWQLCGCYANDANLCPRTQLQPVYDNSNNLVNYQCFFPNPQDTTFPKRISLSTRSAPQRLYTSAGTSLDSWENETSWTQEGTPFFYLDTQNYFGAQNVQDNMNAITGSLLASKAQALPAKVIAVEKDESYVIHSVSGQFQLCPLCPQEEWSDNLKAFPRVQSPSGLKATGYTTTREFFSFNYALANEEDSKYGRACFIPPTMIPFSDSSTSTRSERLIAKSFLFSNGYQRDWFGFNHGALIGSFDGLHWFAIGASRRVVAQTNKLFLAINTPFSDLANFASYQVDIDRDKGQGTASLYDYDPSLDLEDPGQNTGASCQYWHQCQSDNDCVTKLGWEYQCTDVTLYKNYKPQFDRDAEEIGTPSLKRLTEILQGNLVGDKKRCVYRGLGAPCFINQGTNNAATTRAFQCAPNFTCQASNLNTRFTRDINPVNALLYGYEKDALGRPQYYYQNKTGTLNATVAEAILANSIDPSIATGLCAPIANPDFINQIGNCSNCPAFAYDSTKKVFTDYDNSLASKQNMCVGDYLPATTFSSLLSALNPTSLLTVSFSPEACSRQAGAPCFNDLDCAPNRYHAERAESLSISAFRGSTLAEKEFWEQDLICGQGAIRPSLTYDKNYDITKNRCCRDIGKDFTAYSSEALPSFSIPDSPSENSGLNAATNYSRFDHTTIKPHTATINSLQNQWKAIQSAGNSTCCGGGWVRKFSDGTHDWKNNKRLQLNVSNFACLNYDSELFSSTTSQEYGFFCLSPNDKGCIQRAIATAGNFKIVPPESANAVVTATIVTSPLIKGDLFYYATRLSVDTPYIPIADPSMGATDGLRYPFLQGNNGAASQIIKFRRPDYMVQDPTAAFIYYCDDKGENCNPTVATLNAALGNNQYDFDATDRTYTFELNHAANDSTGATWRVAGAALTFAPERNTDLGLKAGNNNYYLSRLGRLELLGLRRFKMQF
jgi:hypothetical protein